MYQKFEVGSLYKPKKTNYNEGTRFDFLQSGAVLELFYDRPTPGEIQDVTKGRFELGFYEKDEVIFMLFRFGSGQYMDAPYTAHLSAPFEFMEKIEQGLGFGLNVFLVDAATGILRAMRYVGLSNDFSQRFKKAVERQKKQGFDKTAYAAAIQMVYANYSTKDLARRADAWCKIK